MLNLISLIKMQHKKFGLLPLEKPGFLSDELNSFRTNFTLEELTEFANSCKLLLDNSSLKFKNVPYGEMDLESALDALIDMTVVIFGTAYLMGFFNKANNLQIFSDGETKTVENNNEDYTIFEEAFNRVWQANIQKRRVVNASESKRGSAFDLIKPTGWKPPQFKDLLQ